MADKEMTIMFPEEKMEALEFFMREQNEKMDDMLKAYLEKVYEKNVPLQVRKYVESRLTGIEGEISQGNSGQGHAKRGRQSVKQNAVESIHVEGTEKEAGQESVELQAENELLGQEETGSMEMSM